MDVTRQEEGISEEEKQRDLTRFSPTVLRNLHSILKVNEGHELNE